MSKEIINYPFGYDYNHREYYGFNIEEKSVINSTFRFSHITTKGFDIYDKGDYDDQDHVYMKMIQPSVITKLEDTDLDEETREVLVDNIVRFTNEFWSFAELFVAEGNKIQILKENNGDWEANDVLKVLFNDKQVFCPTENYLNIVDYMIKEGFTVIGVDADSRGVVKSKFDLLKQSMIDDIEYVTREEKKLNNRRDIIDIKMLELEKMKEEHNE